jgi:flagellar export protein FliJ
VFQVVGTVAQCGGVRMAKRFKWRLDTVKKAKERHEDQKKQALGEAQSSQNTEEARLAELRAARRDQTDRLKTKQAGKLNAQDLQASHAYISNLEQKIDDQNRRLEVAKQITDSRRTDLVKAVQENKVLENLRTRDHQVFKKSEQKREQAETDETANRASHRRKQEDSET